MRTVVLTLAVLAGCASEPPKLGKTLPDCSYRGPMDAPDTELFEHPVIREGGSFVGITTERYDRPGAAKEPGPHRSAWQCLRGSQELGESR